MRLIRLSIYSVLALLMVVVIAPLQANPPALPPLPSSTIINQVISQTGGPTYTPLKAPKSIKTSLKEFGKVFEGVHKWVSKKEAISYIANGGVVQEVVLPLKDSGSHKLKPDMTAPGLEERPGKVVGAVYQPERGTMVLVAVFNGNSSKPDKIRMYYKNKKYYEYAVQRDKFNSDPSGTLDEGALLSYNQSCVTVGKFQLCWDSLKDNALRSVDTIGLDGIGLDPIGLDSISLNTNGLDDDDDGDSDDDDDDDDGGGTSTAAPVSEAYERAKNAYDLDIEIFLKDALPDLIGNGTRANCAAALKAAVLPGGSAAGISACDPNLYMSSSTTTIDNQPIVIWVVTRQADLKGFTDEGVYLGYVPAGEYLVVNATPNITTPGQAGVLMLVNINDYNNHYLIPSIRMQQFADRKNPKQQVAAIKDGCTWYYGW